MSCQDGQIPLTDESWLNAARLAKWRKKPVFNTWRSQSICHGAEVPVPGGAQVPSELAVTTRMPRATLEAHRHAFSAVQMPSGHASCPGGSTRRRVDHTNVVIIARRQHKPDVRKLALIFGLLGYQTPQSCASW